MKKDSTHATQLKLHEDLSCQFHQDMFNTSPNLLYYPTPHTKHMNQSQQYCGNSIILSKKFNFHRFCYVNLRHQAYARVFKYLALLTQETGILQ